MRAGSYVFVKVWVRQLREGNGLVTKAWWVPTVDYYFAFVKKRNPNTCKSMERPLGYQMKLNYLAMKGHFLCDSLVGACRRQIYAKGQ